jgi:hypothetical protein
MEKSNDLFTEEELLSEPVTAIKKKAETGDIQRFFCLLVFEE